MLTHENGGVRRERKHIREDDPETQELLEGEARLSTSFAQKQREGLLSAQYDLEQDEKFLSDLRRITEKGVIPPGDLHEKIREAQEDVATQTLRVRGELLAVSGYYLSILKNASHLTEEFHRRIHVLWTTNADMQEAFVREGITTETDLISALEREELTVQQFLRFLDGEIVRFDEEERREVLVMEKIKKEFLHEIRLTRAKKYLPIDDETIKRRLNRVQFKILDPLEPSPPRGRVAGNTVHVLLSSTDGSITTQRVRHTIFHELSHIIFGQNFVIDTYSISTKDTSIRSSQLNTQKAGLLHTTASEDISATRWINEAAIELFASFLAREEPIGYGVERFVFWQFIQITGIDLRTIFETIAETPDVYAAPGKKAPKFGILARMMSSVGGSGMLKRFGEEVRKMLGNMKSRSVIERNEKRVLPE